MSRKKASLYFNIVHLTCNFTSLFQQKLLIRGSALIHINIACIATLIWVIERFKKYIENSQICGNSTFIHVLFFSAKNKLTFGLENIIFQIFFDIRNHNQESPGPNTKENSSPY